MLCFAHHELTNQNVNVCVCVHVVYFVFIVWLVSNTTQQSQRQQATYTYSCDLASEKCAKWNVATAHGNTAREPVSFVLTTMHNRQFATTHFSFWYIAFELRNVGPNLFSYVSGSWNKYTYSSVCRTTRPNPHLIVCVYYFTEHIFI